MTVNARVTSRMILVNALKACELSNEPCCCIDYGEGNSPQDIKMQWPNRGQRQREEGRPCGCIMLKGSFDLDLIEKGTY